MNTLLSHTSVKKLELLYSGKAKNLFKTDNNQLLWMEFRDDATAFNNLKKAKFAHKGAINNQFNAFMMQKLHEHGIPVHFHQLVSPTESLVKHLKMIPVECIVRNLASGGLCKRLAIEDGIDLQPPIFEFFLKNDALGDPMINESHIITFGWAAEFEIKRMKELSLAVNDILKPLFAQVGLILVDYKLEFGRDADAIVLGDELTPDGCRLWDAKTRERLDKDRFRRDLGNVMEGYQEVARRLGIDLVMD